MVWCSSLLSGGQGLLVGQGPGDVRVSRVGDGHGAHAVVLSAGCPQLNVVACVVVDSGAGEHSVVLDLRLPTMARKIVSVSIGASRKVLSVLYGLRYTSVVSKSTVSSPSLKEGTILLITAVF